MVSAGEDPIVFNGRFGPMSMSFTMVGPPQADQERLFRLAEYHLTAFFYHQTYDVEKQRGMFWQGCLSPALFASCRDWGNPVFGWFETLTKPWPIIYQLVTADGFFRLWIRHRERETSQWAWAIEWNKDFRLIGFFGDEAAANSLLEAKPDQGWKEHSCQGNIRRRYRLEVPLQNGLDALFPEILSRS